MQYESGRQGAAAHATSDALQMDGAVIEARMLPTNTVAVSQTLCGLLAGSIYYHQDPKT